MGLSFGNLFASLTLESGSFMSGIRAAQKELRETQRTFARVGGQMQKVGAIMTAGITAPLAGIGAAGVAAATEFGQAMSNVATLVDTSRESIDDMGKSVLAISQRVPVQIGDLTSALYDVRSAGIDAADAMSVLEGSARLGVAGLGSTAEATDLVTSSVNAFNLKGAEQAKVYDNIFRTVKAGKTTISELTQGFGAVVPVVAQAGGKLDEYLASVAALTTTGLPAAQAQSQIRAAIAGLMRDSKELSGVFAKLGAKDLQGLIQSSGGLVGAFVKIREATGGNDQQLLKLIGSIEGYNAVVGLTGQNNAAFTQTLAGMRDGSDALNEAVAKQAGTTAAKMQEMRNSLQASAIQIGTALAPAIEQLAALLTELAQWFSTLSPETQKWAIGLAALAAAVGPVLLGVGTMVSTFGALLPVMSGLVPVIWAVGSALLSLLANPVVLGAAVVIGGIYLAWKNWDKIEPIVRNLYVGVKTWIVDKLGAVFGWLHDKLGWIADKFKWLDDVVVRHSYIPDMVDSIGEHIARLDTLMVAPVRHGTEAAAQAFQQLQQRVSGLLDRLFPDQAKFAQFKRDMDDLAAYAAKAGMAPDALREAQRRLAKEAYGDNAPPSVLSEGLQVDILKDVKSLPDQIKHAWGQVQKANAKLGDSFAAMSRNVTSSLQGLVSSIRSGDWLSSLQGVVDLIAQLGSTGIFGKSFAASMGSFRTFGGGRAIGGPVMPMTDYLVGERGPEILRMGRQGGSIVPNDQIGGRGGQLTIRLSPELEAEWLQKSAGQSVQILQAAAPGMLSTASAKARRDAARPVTPGGQVG